MVSFFPCLNIFCIVQIMWKMSSFKCQYNNNNDQYLFWCIIIWKYKFWVGKGFGIYLNLILKENYFILFKDDSVSWVGHVWCWTSLKFASSNYEIYVCTNIRIQILESWANPKIDFSWESIGAYTCPPPSLNTNKRQLLFLSATDKHSTFFPFYFFFFSASHTFLQEGG